MILTSVEVIAAYARSGQSPDEFDCPLCARPMSHGNGHGIVKSPAGVILACPTVNSQMGVVSAPFIPRERLYS